MLTAFAIGWAAAAAAAGPEPSLALPVACTPGRDCFVQNYVDHDPGAGWKDYRCRSMTYDHHTGTDIRIPSLAAMRAGVQVRAALAGKVKAVREGVVDKPYGEADAAAVKGRNCGNAVVLEHAGGWTSIYCHLRQGSVRVKPGQAVAARQPLGLVGESGEAAFPHLHFEIRRNGRLVDPFAWGVDPAACAGGRMLWNDVVAAGLAYRSPSVINQGFSSGGVAMGQVEAGQAPAASADGAGLVAFVRAIGLEAGDVQTLTVTWPDGKALGASSIPPLERAKAQYLMFTGKKRPAAGWARGEYRARYEVRRGGRVVLTRDWSLRL
jgi:murein DD-endopeptidase MepM/ murein hydrolase activator NlpD